MPCVAIQMHEMHACNYTEAERMGLGLGVARLLLYFCNRSSITNNNYSVLENYEAPKKRLVLKRLTSLSASYFQGSAMTAMREWRNRLCSYRFRSCHLPPALISLYRGYTTESCSKPSLKNLSRPWTLRALQV